MFPRQLQDDLRRLSLDELRTAKDFVDELIQELEKHGARQPEAAPTGSERREHQRFDVDLSGKFFRHRREKGDQSKPTFFEAVVQDISRGGMRFMTSQVLGNGEILTFFLKSPGGSKKLYVEVMRVTNRGEVYEVGVQYVDQERLRAAQKADELRARSKQSTNLVIGSRISALREEIKDVLLTEGYLAHTVNDPAEAYSRVEEVRPEILVSEPQFLESEQFNVLDAIAEKSIPIAVIAIVEPKELENPSNRSLQQAIDYIMTPPQSGEVRVIVNRVHRRIIEREEGEADSKGQKSA